MNTTLVGLSLKTLGSPFLSLSQRFFPESIIFRNNHFSHFTFPIIFSTSDLLTLNLAQSKFSYCLSRAITISQLSTHKTEFRRHNRNAFLTRILLNVNYLVFSHCYSTERGGAIYAVHKYASMNLFRSGFFDCVSETTNGAIYFNGRTSFCYSTCFDSCIGRKPGSEISQAFFHRCSDDQQNFLNESTVVKCSPPSLQGPDNPGVLWKGLIGVRGLNSSSNAVEKGQGGFAITFGSEENENSFRFVHLHNNSGGSVVRFHRLKFQDEIAYFNFVGNEARDAAILLHDAEVLVLQSVFVRNAGKISRNINNSLLQFNGCRFDNYLDLELFVNGKPMTARCNFGEAKATPIPISILATNACWIDCGKDSACVRENIGPEPTPSPMVIMHAHTPYATELLSD